MKMKFFIGTAIVLAFISCQKFDDEGRALNFDVSVDKTTFTVGEPVVFTFTGGDANLISFYSGEFGNDYEYRNKSRNVEIARWFFSFRTHNTPVGDQNTVYPDLLISTDFDGNYNYESLSTANWEPISQYYYWGERGNWQNVWGPSGPKDITEFIDSDRPFYLAYRVVSPAVPTGSVSRNFRVNQHSLIAETKTGDYIQLADYSGMEWQVVHPFLTPAQVFEFTNTQITSSIFLFGYYGASAPYYRQELELWGVSRRFDLSTDIDMGSEGSIALKEYTDVALESHTHFYETPGVYRVVFIANNVTISSKQEVVKEFTITVLPAE